MRFIGGPLDGQEVNVQAVMRGEYLSGYWEAIIPTVERKRMQYQLTWFRRTPWQIEAHYVDMSLGLVEIERRVQMQPLDEGARW